MEQEWTENGMELEQKLQHHFGWSVLIDLDLYFDEFTSAERV